MTLPLILGLIALAGCGLLLLAGALGFIDGPGPIGPVEPSEIAHPRGMTYAQHVEAQAAAKEKSQVTPDVLEGEVLAIDERGLLEPALGGDVALEPDPVDLDALTDRKAG